MARKIVALLMLNRLTMHNGWVLNRLLLSPDTPYGTSELLILSVLDTLREEGCSFFSIGSGAFSRD